ncbi:hypothetical protein GCM10009751_02750 [Myceligenerans crystallogenes]|uniref:Pilus assembly protein Flp/PilA n=2 Tax=Myceligenerans crystallogenes TaxID=316335 RepID=A0ABN2N5I2_9MICO
MFTEKFVAAKAALDALRERAAQDERGQGSVEYVGIILVVVAIVGAVVAGATPVGEAIVTQLTNAVNEIGGGGEG